ncbi:unnamed protein product [Agarophyton chilense]
MADVLAMCTNDLLYALRARNLALWVTLEHLKPDLDRKNIDRNHVRDLRYPERFDTLVKSLWENIQSKMRDLPPALDTGTSRESEAVGAAAESMKNSSRSINPVSSDEEDFVEDCDSEAVRIMYDTDKTGSQPFYMLVGHLLHKAMKYLEGVMKNSYFAMYHCDQKNLEVTHESLGTEISVPLREIQLFLMDPPYKTRRAQNKTNTNHDRLSEGHMERTAAKTNSVLRPGGHFSIFCATEQFVKWYDILNDSVREVHMIRYQNGRCTRVKQFKPMVRVDKSPLLFVREAGYNMKNT